MKPAAPSRTSQANVVSRFLMDRASLPSQRGGARGILPRANVSRRSRLAYTLKADPQSRRSLHGFGAGGVGVAGAPVDWVAAGCSVGFSAGFGGGAAGTSAPGSRM